MEMGRERGICVPEKVNEEKNVGRERERERGNMKNSDRFEKEGLGSVVF